MLSTIANLKLYLGSTSASDAYLTTILTAASSAIAKFCGRDFESTSYLEQYDGDGSSELHVDNYPIISVSMLSLGKISAFEIINTSSDAYNASVSVNSTSMVLVVSGGANAGSSTLTLATYTSMTTLIAAIAALNKGWGVLANTSLSAWSATELLPMSGSSCFNRYASVYLPDTPETDFSEDAKAGIIKLWGHYPVGFQNITVKYTGGYATIPPDLEQICIELAKSYLDSASQNAALQSESIGGYSYSAKTTSGIPDSLRGRLGAWRRYT